MSINAWPGMEEADMNGEHFTSAPDPRPSMKRKSTGKHFGLLRKGSVAVVASSDEAAVRLMTPGTMTFVTLAKEYPSSKAICEEIAAAIKTWKFKTIIFAGTALPAGGEAGRWRVLADKHELNLVFPYQALSPDQLEILGSRAYYILRRKGHRLFAGVAQGEGPAWGFDIVKKRGFRTAGVCTFDDWVKKNP